MGGGGVSLGFCESGTDLYDIDLQRTGRLGGSTGDPAHDGQLWSSGFRAAGT